LLYLELTESVIAHVGEAVERRLDAIRSLGVEIHIDDFGKGYSSLNYLQSMPGKRLKIDCTFIESIQEGFETHEIVRMMIGTAHRLNMTVVAEGIETQSQHHLLQSLQCDFLQGDYFAPALSRLETLPVLKRLL
jgi:EAL domain-containing protein (putative c-di-GMP-specific phosphodiesterase class I)